MYEYIKQKCTFVYIQKKTKHKHNADWEIWRKTDSNTRKQRDICTESYFNNEPSWIYRQ